MHKKVSASYRCLLLLHTITTITHTITTAITAPTDAAGITIFCCADRPPVFASVSLLLTDNDFIAVKVLRHRGDFWRNIVVTRAFVSEHQIKYPI